MPSFRTVGCLRLGDIAFWSAPTNSSSRSSENRSCQRQVAKCSHLQPSSASPKQGKTRQLIIPITWMMESQTGMMSSPVTHHTSSGNNMIF